jgi:GWxTD domain-containing protein
MKIHNMRIPIDLLLIVCLTWSVFGQEHRPPGEGRDFPERSGTRSSIGVDVLNLPSLDSCKSRLVLLLDIPQSFSVFQRDPDQNHGYSAGCEISIEIFDTSKHSVTRSIVTKNIHRPSPLPEDDPLQPRISQIVIFDLDPGTYDCLIEVTDPQSERRFHHTYRKVLKDFRQRYMWSDIVLLADGIPDSSHISAIPMGGDALFGEKFKIYFEYHPDHDTIREVSIKFFKYEHHPTEKNLIVQDSMPSLVLTHSQIGLLKNDTVLVFPYIHAAGRLSSAMIDIASDKIEYGQYMLELKFLDGKKKIVFGKLMTVRWPSIPRSLLAMDYAIDMLEYELTKSTFDSLKSLSDDEQIRWFGKYWKSKDPTPGTAYNEALEEYYRRVDYARTAYASVKNPDGARSDRGKIAILFGIPYEPERILPTDRAPMEVWTYPGLHKRFIFIDESRSGAYSLVKVEEL